MASQSFAPNQKEFGTAVHIQEMSGHFQVTQILDSGFRNGLTIPPKDFGAVLMTVVGHLTLMKIGRESYGCIESLEIDDSLILEFNADEDFLEILTLEVDECGDCDTIDQLVIANEDINSFVGLLESVAS